MTLPVAYRASLLDYTGDPSVDRGAVRHVDDGLLVVDGGKIVARGAAPELLPAFDGVPLVDYRGHLIVPGFIDAHIHYPQTAMIAAYGAQLLEWLENYTFPTEQRFEDEQYARASAEFFMQELFRNGTTSAVVLGTVHRQSADALASVATRAGARLILGKVLMDRHAPAALCDTAESAYDESRELIERWHGRDRLSYAITPRFAPTCSAEQLAAAARLHAEHPTTYVHTHLSENRNEIEWVHSLFPERANYTDVYDHFGLVGRRSVFAHGIHLSDGELELLARREATIAFCPTSNLFLGSGLFPYERVRAAGVSVALATDVGAGTSFSMLRTLSEAYKVLQLQGFSLSVHHGLYLATLGGAASLVLDSVIGNLEPGKEADFVVLDWDSTPLLALRSREARDFDDRLFALTMMADDRAVAHTYVAGRCAHSRK